MNTRILKATLVLSSILLLQACSAQQLANLNSCTDPTAWGCGGGSRAVNDMSEREARYRAELAE